MRKCWFWGHKVRARSRSELGQGQWNLDIKYCQPNFHYQIVKAYIYCDFHFQILEHRVGECVANWHCEGLLFCGMRLLIWPWIFGHIMSCILDISAAGYDMHTYVGCCFGNEACLYNIFLCKVFNQPISLSCQVWMTFCVQQKERETLHVHVFGFYYAQMQIKM